MSRAEAMARLAAWLDQAEGFSSITLSREEGTGYLLTLSVSVGPACVDLAHAEGTQLERVVDAALRDAPRSKGMARMVFGEPD